MCVPNGRVGVQTCACAGDEINVLHNLRSIALILLFLTFNVWVVEDSFPRLLSSSNSVFLFEEYLAVLADVAMLHLHNAWWMHKLQVKHIIFFFYIDHSMVQLQPCKCQRISACLW